jgi:hypothetical protein
MSRLIDADTLPISSGWIEQGNQKVHITFAYEYDIQNNPTVDAAPVVHGHWRRGKSYPHNIYCSNCYRTYVPNDELEMWKDWTRLPRRYCPECGALMDEVVE